MLPPIQEEPDVSYPEIDEIKPTGIPGRVASAVIDPGAIALWHTGGAGYFVKTAGATILNERPIRPEPRVIGIGGGFRF